MRSIIITFLFLFCTQQVLAEGKPLEVQFQGKKYDLMLNQGKLLAISGTQKIQGKLEKRIASFSQWQFQLSENAGFEVVINEKLKKILHQRNDLGAGGPFLAAASPDSKYVVFDYGTGPTLRDLEVRTADGKVVFKDAYFDFDKLKLTWRKSGLEYARPEKELPINFNAKTKSCESVGAAYEVQRYTFNGKEKKKVDKAPSIECSN